MPSLLLPASSTVRDESMPAKSIVDSTKSMSETITTTSDTPQSKMSSLTSDTNTTPISIPDFTCSAFIPDLISNPDLPLHTSDEGDKEMLNWAFREAMFDNELYTKHAGMTLEAAMEKTRTKVNNLICILNRMNEVKRERADLKGDLTLMETESKYETEGFEEELASRDHQILEQDEQIRNLKEKVHQTELSLLVEEETRKQREVDLKEVNEMLVEAEELLMDAAVELRQRRTSSKRSREASEQDEFVPAKRTK